MELLTPAEHAIVMRCTGHRNAEIEYVLAIKRLIQATDSNTRTYAEIFAAFTEVKATLAAKNTKIIDLGSEYNDNLYSRLHTLFIDLKEITQIDQNLLDARNNLILGLSEAQKRWISNNEVKEPESWYIKKAESMKMLLSAYADYTEKTMPLLTKLQNLKAQVWLAESQSRTIECSMNLGIR